MRPTFTTPAKEMWRNTRDWRTRGTRIRRTSARNTTDVKVSKAIATCRLVLDGRIAFGAQWSIRYVAIFTVIPYIKNVFAHEVGSIPGKNANMFGRVLPIQNGV
jgi:hypothetical protein